MLIYLFKSLITLLHLEHREFDDKETYSRQRGHLELADLAAVTDTSFCSKLRSLLKTGSVLEFSKVTSETLNSSASWASPERAS